MTAAVCVDCGRPGARVHAEQTEPRCDECARACEVYFRANAADPDELRAGLERDAADPNLTMADRLMARNALDAPDDCTCFHGSGDDPNPDDADGADRWPDPDNPCPIHEVTR